MASFVRAALTLALHRCEVAPSYLPTSRTFSTSSAFRNVLMPVKSLFYPREQTDIEHHSRLSAPVNPASTGHWPSLFAFVAGTLPFPSKGLSLVRLEFVVFGVTKETRSNVAARPNRSTRRKQLRIGEPQPVTGRGSL